MSRTAKHNEIIADLFHQGYTLQMIADRAGISKPGVQKAVNRLNLHRTRSDAHKKKNQLLVNLEAENAHLREKLAVAVSLLKTMRDGHADGTADAYLFCDTEPCEWCIGATAIIDGKEANDES